MRTPCSSDIASDIRGEILILIRFLRSYKLLEIERGVFGQLLGLSGPQPDESGPDRAEACVAPRKCVCQCQAPGGSPPDGQALPGRGVPDEPAEKTPEHLSAVTRCHKPMTRALA